MLKRIDWARQYYISDEGHVYKKTRDGLRQMYEDYTSGGYARVRIGSGNDRLYLHKLVAEEYVPNDKPGYRTIVSHIDKDKTNNSAENLVWISQREKNLISEWNVPYRKAMLKYRLSQNDI